MASLAEHWSLLLGLNPWAWLIQLALVPVALIYANFFEWAFHKYVLHGLGRKRGSFWSFHWADHHRNARRNAFEDPDYKTLFAWNAQTKELIALSLGAVVHLPVALVAPLAYVALLYSGMSYFFTHRRAHLDPEWARTALPWHYDHHMAPDQDANWCVTRPWFDLLLGTRKSFVSTAK